MAKDPPTITGPVKDSDTLEGVFLTNKKNKDRDLQRVDARLRQAVASGDENYVRSRLGGDHALSDVEMQMIIKTRREAEQNVSQLFFGAQAVEAEKKVEEQREQETFTMWARRYVAARAEAAAHPKEDVGTTRYLDSNGRDPYGYKFVADFGYDQQGNYRDSFGGRLGTDNVYHADTGEDADMVHRIVTHGNDAYNDQTGDIILFNEETNSYRLMRRNESGHMASVRGDDGKPVTMNRQERDDLIQHWRETNDAATPADMTRMRATMANLDNERAGAVADDQLASVAGAASHEHGSDAATPSERSGAASANGSEEVPSTHPPGPSPAPNPQRSGPIALVSRANAAISEARLAMAAEAQLSKRTADYGGQFQRTQSRLHGAAKNAMATVATAAVGTSTGSGVALGSAIGAATGNTYAADYTPISDADKQKLLNQASGRANSTPGAPKFALGVGSTGDTSTSTVWLKDEKNGGTWDDKGGYYDKLGGYWDKQGGYYDAKGNYTDQYGGYRSTDGSYMDSKGNYVDKQGNLWLAGNDTDKPDFPKKEGVNYVDVLAKAAENRYEFIRKDNTGVTDDEARELETKLRKIDDDFKIAHSGPQPAKPAPATQSNFFTPPATSSSAEPDSKETVPVSLKRPTTSTSASLKG